MQPNSRGPEDHPEDHPEGHPEDRPEGHPEGRPEGHPEGHGLCHKVDRQGQVVPCLGLECREEQVVLCPECRKAHKERVLQ